MIDIEKSEKLPPEHRYFNISVVWIFYFRWVLRLFYWLRIPHEVVTALSIASGLTSAFLFYRGALIAAAVALHLKDVFDACDGALARLTGRGHLAGRYLDSVGDFLTLTSVMAAISFRAAMAGGLIYVFWGALAIVSTFLQCSFFNYYQLAYLERFGIDSLSSRKDEVSRRDVNEADSPLAGKLLLHISRYLYIAVYAWQDRLVALVDKDLYTASHCLSEQRWYGDRTMMVLQSALCFGTQIFVIIIFTIIGRPQQGLVFIGSIMNVYLFLVLYFRWRRFRVRTVQQGRLDEIERTTKVGL